MACTTRKPRKKKAKIIAIDDVMYSSKGISVWFEELKNSYTEAFSIAIKNEKGVFRPIQGEVQTVNGGTHIRFWIKGIDGSHLSYEIATYPIDKELPTFQITEEGK